MWRKLKSWVVRNWKGLVWLVSMLMFVLALIFLKKGKIIPKLMMRSEVSKYELEVAKLEGRRELLMKETSGVEAEIDMVDKELAAYKEKIAYARKIIGTLNDQEKLDKFRDLGY